MENSALQAPSYLHSERRISYLTLLIGVVAAIPVAYLRGDRWGAGIFIGALLAWLNFRWLGRGLDALMEASTDQSIGRKANVPVGTYFKALFRYGLIALSVYAIFKALNVPVLSMILGLFALGTATLAVSVLEILRHQE
jgi:small-conductance mechanosensitive channel